MAHSPLLQTRRADAAPRGHDTADLGPSDSSDSGSDLAGIEQFDTGDPTAPVDAALRDGQTHALLPVDVLAGGASDAAGSGERRSAASDGGRREAADIGADRIIHLADGLDEGEGEEDDDEAQLDLAFADAVESEGADPEALALRRAEEAEEDDGREISLSAAATPGEPPKPNPEPDPPDHPVRDDPPPADENDRQEHKPGRT